MAEMTTEKPSATTLADVMDFAGSNRLIRVRVKRALNLGSNTMLTSLDIGTFLLQSMVGNDPLKGAVTQRKLDMSHSQKMAVFIFKGLVNFAIDRRRQEAKGVPEEAKKIAAYLGTQPYYAWSPIVGSIRDSINDISVDIAAADAGELELKLRSNQLIWVVDGQHRRMAWQIVLDFLNQLVRDRKYTKSGGLAPTDMKQVADDAVSFWHEALMYYTDRFSVSIDLHFGLSIDQERQLFHDLNNLQKTVSTSQAQAFDQSNPINIFTHRLRESEMFSDAQIVEDGRVDWDSEAWMKLDQLNAINARLFLNQTTISGARPAEVVPREDKAWVFWEAVTKIPNIFSRKESVAAQAALLKAMARTYFELLWSRKPEGEGVAEQFLEALTTIDFSHDNPLWDIEHMEDDKVSEYPELINFLPDKWRQKQIGERVDGKVRFGSRHNESILVLPGIIRYLAKLPPAERRTGEQAEGREKADHREVGRPDKATAQLMKALGVDEETAKSVIAEAKAKGAARGQ
jgi:DNA-sulfur modification-associated